MGLQCQEIKNKKQKSNNKTIKTHIENTCNIIIHNKSIRIIIINDNNNNNNNINNK